MPVLGCRHMIDTSMIRNITFTSKDQHTQLTLTTPTHQLNNTTMINSTRSPQRGNDKSEAGKGEEQGAGERRAGSGERRPGTRNVLGVSTVFTILPFYHFTILLLFLQVLFLTLIPLLAR